VVISRPAWLDFIHSSYRSYFTPRRNARCNAMCSGDIRLNCLLYPQKRTKVHRSKIASNLAPSSESACVERSVPLHPRWTLNSSFFSRERAKQGTRENYHAKCEAVDDERPT
jgi:hypothetical protein